MVMVLFPDCDETCESCYGDGPDMCTKCVPGMVLRDGVCTGKLICLLISTLGSQSSSSGRWCNSRLFSCVSDLESVLALTSMRSHKWYKNGSKYLTYLGLLALTGLVLLKSVWMAAIIGSALAAYVAINEYLPKTESR